MKRTTLSETDNVVRAARRKLGLGVRDYAKKLGISHATLSRIENGKPPSIEVALQVSRAMNLRVEDIWK